MRLPSNHIGKNDHMRPISRVTPWVFAALVLTALVGVGLFVSSASRAPVMSGASEGTTTKAEDGDLRFRIVDVQRNVTQIGDPIYGATPRASYTVVTLAVRNTGSSTATFDGAYVVGRDRDGRRVTADREATAILNDDGVGRLTQIAAGERIVTKVAFDVQSRMTQIQVHDSVFSRGAGLRLGHRVQWVR